MHAKNGRIHKTKERNEINKIMERADNRSQGTNQPSHETKKRTTERRAAIGKAHFGQYISDCRGTTKYRRNTDTEYE